MWQEHLDVFLGTWTCVAELLDVELVRNAWLLAICRYRCLVVEASWSVVEVCSDGVSCSLKGHSLLLPVGYVRLH